ncbi:hypothetical protein FDECE_5387 [Fusarium decemcellulare]|nr:hypothetical protein FDECE_5387 [Fusarium decemcellulare]
MAKYDNSSEGIILVLGVTGAGKSYFLNRLKDHSAKEGHSLRSETSECQAVQIYLDEDRKRSITVVDTPGFDDTERPHTDVLAEITDFLTAQHSSGVPLRGILYLHKITDNKMTGSSMTYLRLFESLVGEDALQNVILVTTMWNRVRDEYRSDALRHEQELLDDFWAPMEDKGSYVAQFDGTPKSAYSLVFQLAAKESVVLDIQKELVDQDRSLLETSAGAGLIHQLEEDREVYQLQLAKLDAQLQRELKSGSKDKVRDLKDKKAQVEKILRLMDESMGRMSVRPGGPMRERIKQAVRTGGREVKGHAVVVLAAVLNVTLFVVQLTVGGF